METELLKAKKLEAIGIFVGGIAHDLNNLLASISGYIQLSQMNAQEGSKIYDYLRVRAKITSHSL